MNTLKKATVASALALGLVMAGTGAAFASGTSSPSTTPGSSASQGKATGTDTPEANDPKGTADNEKADPNDPKESAADEKAEAKTEGKDTETSDGNDGGHQDPDGVDVGSTGGSTSGSTGGSSSSSTSTPSGR